MWVGRGPEGRPGNFASRAPWSAREIELQALATLAALAQISTPSARSFPKISSALSAKVEADQDRQKKAASMWSAAAAAAPASGANRRIRPHPPANFDSCSMGYPHLR
jgi:hypothetical protein